MKNEMDSFAKSLVILFLLIVLSTWKLIDIIIFIINYVFY